MASLEYPSPHLPAQLGKSKMIQHWDEHGPSPGKAGTRTAIWWGAALSTVACRGSWLATVQVLLGPDFLWDLDNANLFFTWPDNGTFENQAKYNVFAQRGWDFGAGSSVSFEGSCCWLPAANTKHVRASYGVMQGPWEPQKPLFWGKEAGTQKLY